MLSKPFLTLGAAALIQLAAACALGQPNFESMRRINPRMPPPPQIDAAQAQANGLIAVSGNHLSIYTDVRDEALLSGLVQAFDAAVPQWCELFQLRPSQAREWHLIAVLAVDKNRFANTGLWPDDLPEFPAGYNRGHQFWMYLQEGNYYTRHLMLHEGTHAFMQWFLGGSGPPWYSEGMAELVGLHSLNEGLLALSVRPKSRETVEHWGRPKLIRKALDANRFLTLDQVFDFPNSAFQDVESYAWAWAACDFLNDHPLARGPFQKLIERSADTSPQFSRTFKSRLLDDWPSLERDWRLFISELDYGTESHRAGLAQAMAQKKDDHWHLDLATDQSWQRTGIRVEAGDRLQLTARGRFQVAGGETPWPAEGGGITIQYYRGVPLGCLMAAVWPDDEALLREGAPLATRVGLQGDVTAEFTGELILRINESPARLGDNQGALAVTITPAK